MRNKKVIFLAILFLLSLVVLVVFLVFSGNKKAPAPTQPTTTTSPKRSSADIERFSKSFIRDFTTYSYKNTAEYMERLEKYVDSGYFPDFKSRFSLPKQEIVRPDQVENFSKYELSNEVITSEENGRTGVYVRYTETKKDAPGRPIEFKNEKAVNIFIKESNGELKIIKVDFSTTN